MEVRAEDLSILTSTEDSAPVVTSDSSSTEEQSLNQTTTTEEISQTQDLLDISTVDILISENVLIVDSNQTVEADGAPTISSDDILIKNNYDQSVPSDSFTIEKNILQGDSILNPVPDVVSVEDITQTLIQDLSTNFLTENISDPTSDLNQNNLITQMDLSPLIVESDTNEGKLIVVSVTDEQEAVKPMIDVPVKISIKEIFKISEQDNIKIKWQNNQNQEMQFIPVDEDGNGYIDHLQWIVPHLSTQTFEVIFISKAFLLDANKNIVSDIYDKVRYLDQNYADINDGQYIRVTFDHILDENKDITIYVKPKDNSIATVEVYDESGNLIATFDPIDHEGKYKILLNNLSVPSDTFDLKVSGVFALDYIIDPNVRYWVSGGDGNWSSTTNWSTTSGGLSGASVPDSASDVVFDIGSSNSFIDTSFIVGSLTISSGYTGTITQNANLSITDSGGLSGIYSQTGTAIFTANDPVVNLFSVTGNFSIISGIFKRYMGMGSSTDPYVVYDIYGIQAIKVNLTNSFILNNNIDALVTSNWNSGAGFYPLGSNATPFSGIFDGNGYNINNLTINSNNLNYVGLFGYSTNIIQNITITDLSMNVMLTAGTNGIDGGDGSSGNPGTVGGNGTAGLPGGTLYIGGLVAYNVGTINNSRISSGTIIGVGSAGGISGKGGIGGTGTGSSAAGAGGVGANGSGGGNIYVGGISGYQSSGLISNSFSSATVQSTGGLAGSSGSGGNGGNNISTGAGGAGGAGGLGGTGGISIAGGLVGWINTGVIDNSYSTGNVTSSGGLGGVGSVGGFWW